MRITQQILLSIVLSLQLTYSQYLPKPWPTYSQENMPRTDFSCQGKILGGYYADSETQCQMFHVCVKVAGVGIKDFRFLCPNGTAFDQEAQICADWGDVDCEQSTLYYSSDNFDLYRLGSGFESKRAPVAEDEQPFHLQNAESNDLRRTHQQPHNIQSFKRNNVPAYNDESYSNKQNYAGTRHAPKARSTTTTSTTTTTEATYQAERRGDDEIFKGSHSSNFFNNRNNGKEDDLVDFPQKPQQQRNYISRGRQRPQNNFRNNYANNNNNIQAFPTKANDAVLDQSPVTTSTTLAPPTTTRYRPTIKTDTSYSGNVKTVSLQSSFRTAGSQDTSASDLGFYTSTTETLPFQRISYQEPNGFYKSTTQQRVQPTTYSPPLSPFTGSSPSNDDYRSFEKTSTTTGQKFKQPSHNSFYNAQFENKATESYEQFRNQGIPNPSIGYQPLNRTISNINDFAQPIPKSGDRLNAQVQTPFNEAPQPFNERQNSYSQRQNSFSTRQPQPFDEKRNNFNENPTEQQAAQIIGANPANTFEPQRSRRPTHIRGSSNYNKPTFTSDASFGHPLSVRPLEIQIQTQTSTTTESPKVLEQSNVNGFGNSYRSPQRTSPSASANADNTPIGFALPDLNRASPPSPFSLPSEQRRQPERSSNATKQNDRFAQNTFQALSSFNESPRGFSLNPPYPNQNQQQPRTDNTTPFTSEPKRYDDKSFDNYTPATQAKKFSTLVPKDQFYPTTFRPATYKKVIQNYEQKVATSTKFAAASYLPTSTSTTLRPQPQPQPASGNADEDDGQYHPELYEKEFSRNKFKSRKPQPPLERSFNRRPIEPPTDTEDDEFLNTAHSLNIAAGANQLRAEKTKQSSLGSFRAAPTGPTITTITTTTRRPIPTQRSQKNPKSQNKNRKGTNEDTSYDYAYYDSFSGNPQDYEYDLISEFGKTRKN